MDTYAEAGVDPRQPFGASEDRNDEALWEDLAEITAVAPALRGWRGSQRRRRWTAVRHQQWRQPFGAGEDRNTISA
ncbi:hypothetical protein [Saccharopolyspora sp. NPDC002376]